MRIAISGDKLRARMEMMDLSVRQLRQAFVRRLGEDDAPTEAAIYKWLRGDFDPKKGMFAMHWIILTDILHCWSEPELLLDMEKAA